MHMRVQAGLNIRRQLRQRVRETAVGKSMADFSFEPCIFDTSSNADDLNVVKRVVGSQNQLFELFNELVIVVGREFEKSEGLFKGDQAFRASLATRSVEELFGSRLKLFYSS